MNRRLFIERFDRIIDIIDKYIIFFVLTSSLTTFFVHLIFEDDIYYSNLTFVFVIIFPIIMVRFFFYFNLWLVLIKRNCNRTFFVIAVWFFTIIPFFTLFLNAIAAAIHRDSMSYLVVTTNLVMIWVVARFRVKHRVTINNVLM